MASEMRQEQEGPVHASCLNSDTLNRAHDLHEVFFGAQNIQNTLRLLLATQSVNDRDFLTQVLGVMCTHSVQYVFTEHGFTPFCAMPLVILALPKMTQTQLMAVDEALSKSAHDMTNFKVGSLMGGGSSVQVLHAPRDVLNTVDVLVALYNIIASSQNASNSNARVDAPATFNLILQRLVCSIGLSREQIVRVRESIFAQKE
jgi:hypothetical protein